MRRVTKVLFPAAVAVSAAALAMVTVEPSALAAQGMTVIAGSSTSANNNVAANEALVTYFYDQLFNDNNYSVLSLLSPDFIQHNPTVANGAAALEAFVQSMRVKYPDNHNTIVQVTGQGDLVMIQHHAISVPGTEGTAIIDIFRVSDGKIAEHWDDLQAVPATTASGNDMFSSLVPVGNSTTQQSEAVVLSYFNSLMRNKNLSAVDCFVSPSLVQHDPALPDGSAAVKAAYAADFLANPQLTVSSLMVVADGDLVTLRYHLQNNPQDLGEAVTEIFRVDNGKIVEHWSVEQAVPATSANDNTMF